MRGFKSINMSSLYLLCAESWIYLVAAIMSGSIDLHQAEQKKTRRCQL